MTTDSAAPQALRRILGVGFGLAMAFGATVGVGILRLPGTVAAALGDQTLIAIAWTLGGVYSLLGAVAIAELGAMLPASGGFYVYARRAFGPGIGFVIGWSDWASNISSVAYASVTAATFLGRLWGPAALHEQSAALAILAFLTALHWVGLRFGRALTSTVCVAVGLMLIGLVIGCFFVTPLAPPPDVAPVVSAAGLPLASMALLAAVVTALRSVLITFDGWYSAIYVAEESTNPTRTLPRAIIGGTLLVAGLYLLINIGYMRALPIPVLAASSLPAADVAKALLPHGGNEVVTVISLLTVLSLINTILIISPRILFALGRDGLCTQKAAAVSASGTPRFALAMSAVVAALMVLTGTFEQLTALFAVFFLFNYISGYTAAIVLRYREPSLPRPYRAFGFPLTTAVVLVGSVLFLVAAVEEDHRSGIIAGVLLLAAIPIYAVIKRRGLPAPAA